MARSHRDPVYGQGPACGDDLGCVVVASGARARYQDHQVGLSGGLAKSPGDQRPGRRG